MSRHRDIKDVLDTFVDRTLMTNHYVLESLVEQPQRFQGGRNCNWSEELPEQEQEQERRPGGARGLRPQSLPPAQNTGLSKGDISPGGGYCIRQVVNVIK